MAETKTNKKTCRMCSKSWVRETSRHRNATFENNTLRGLHCTHCKQYTFICELCISAIVEKISKVKKSLFDINPFLKTLKEYHDNMIDDDKLKIIQEKGFKNVCCDYSKEELLTNEKAKNSFGRQQALEYDGSLFCPNIKVLIEANFDCIDVNGIGSDPLQKHKGIVHAVVGQKVAAHLAEDKSIESSFCLRDMDFKTEYKTINIPSLIGDEFVPVSVCGSWLVILYLIVFKLFC